MLAQPRKVAHCTLDGVGGHVFDVFVKESTPGNDDAPLIVPFGRVVPASAEGICFTSFGFLIAVDVVSNRMETACMAAFLEETHCGTTCGNENVGLWRRRHGKMPRQILRRWGRRRRRQQERCNDCFHVGGEARHDLAKLLPRRVLVLALLVGTHDASWRMERTVDGVELRL
ncbi:hypothetical protein H310_07518 [Aphanomyces invadans]|uniref:Uncharacterized protein n=1 Tax=Aphanomyces invadans TaxID=157072 RepID=A0A024U3A0_9STRA|nr:hypothetical protein H310_07518 [Aphanomyces invadans]ETW00093.1 hypothetical protein H310_07518 [Aphanomyces invadans]|eukprot:XP_008871118.1 hypothetical protein H310_07518 [Aphanomyces invadans]